MLRCLTTCVLESCGSRPHGPIWGPWWSLNQARHAPGGTSCEASRWPISGDSSDHRERHAYCNLSSRRHTAVVARACVCVSQATHFGPFTVSQLRCAGGSATTSLLFVSLVRAQYCVWSIFSRCASVVGVPQSCMSCQDTFRGEFRSTLPQPCCLWRAIFTQAHLLNNMYQCLSSPDVSNTRLVLMFDQNTTRQ